jgi:alpha-tubulin suppressor-like RCC1 family protein
VTWRLDGEAAAQGPSLPYVEDAGEASCEVSPYDGLARGAPLTAEPISTASQELRVSATHACARRADALWCWGSNLHGEVGVAQHIGTGERVAPTQVFASGVTAFALGDGFTCAIRDGALWCWGTNIAGQLGIGEDVSAESTSTPRLVFAADVQAVSAGATHACAVHAGAVKCWGDNRFGSVGRAPDETSGEVVARPHTVLAAGATAVSAGGRHTCAIHEGTLKCWGMNIGGQLGRRLNAMFSTPQPVEVPLVAPTAVSAGGAHTCAIASGALWCWGFNNAGQVGAAVNEGLAGDPTPRRVLEDGVSAVSAGGAHTCALHHGELKCWGDNTSGQLGLIDPQGRVEPTSAAAVLPGRTAAVSAGERSTCAVHGRQLKCWGDNASGQLAQDGAQRSSPGVVPGLGVVEGVFLGESHACVISEGALKCWGQNSAGQLGAPPLLPSRALRVMLEGEVTAVALGGQHTCAVRRGALYCAGANHQGQLGLADERLVPALEEVFDSGVSLVGAGVAHTCAVHQGALKCWGDNSAGQTGDVMSAGTSQGAHLPSTVFEGQVSALAAGGRHTCAVHQGALKCWGENRWGQLGVSINAGAEHPTATPQVVFEDGVTALACGEAHTCAVHRGALKCWGQNLYGQLGVDQGLSTLSPVASPVTVAVSDVDGLAAGARNTCASSRGALRCWGDNARGQLAAPSVPAQPAPRLVLEGVSTFGVGAGFMCAGLRGEVRCWGDNSSYQLGYGLLNTHEPLTIALR